ncbi:MAG: two-component regulator propeller domain-containing protein [Gracilimonas sp.]|nr:two-component regulator propeller domain-containing protein [Gracilimonas sp.]
MKYLLLVISFLGLAAPLFAQNFEGYPTIRNYTAEEYEGNVQNWGFTEDTNGVLFISNLQSVMMFDGVEWLHFSVDNGRTYSLNRTANGTIYVGGNGEFGYLDKPTDPDVTTLQYYSLRHLLPDTLDLDRFYNIVSVQDTVFFLANNALIRYDNSDVKIFRPNVRFSSIFKKDGKVYVRDALEGIKQIHSDTLTNAFGGTYFKENTLFSFLETSKGDLFCSYSKCTRFDGSEFKVLDFEANTYFENHYLDEGIVLSDGTLAFATRAGGVLHTDVDGNLLQVFNEEAGLIDNTVYGIYEDRNGSIWVATIGGISRIDYSLPIKYFDERAGISENVNHINQFQDQLIFSTSTGIYFRKNLKQLNKIDFNENCTQTIVLESELYASCGQKIYHFEDNEFQIVEGLFGYKMLQYPNTNIMITANERGVLFSELQGDKSNVIYSIDDLSILPVSILKDKENNIWFGHRSGVHKVDLVWRDRNIIAHNENEYLHDLTNTADDNRVDVTSIKDKLFFLTWGKGIQAYDYERDQMYQYEGFGPFFSDTTKQYFFAEEDQEGNIWFRSGGDNQALLKKSDNTYELYIGPLKLIDSQQFNTIYTGDRKYIWYGTDEGLVQFKKEHTFDHTKTFYTKIKEVLVRNDSLINGNNSSKVPVLRYNDNQLRFTYSAASYYAKEENEYRVKLSGFDADWTAWSSEAQKDYTNIPEGDYEFKVQARNVFGVVSESAGFTFEILPPWYRTWWAYMLYIFSIAGILYTAYKIRVNQLLRVERIRNHIASDLHDEISATLSSISYFAQAIESDKMKGDKSRFLKLISNSAGDAKEKITDIVWAINPEHDDWQGFLSKCRRYASDLLESKVINYSLKIDEYIPGKLDMQLRQHLWLIFKEMITNAARHSEAKQVDVIMKYEEGLFKLVVQDDGKGMDVDGVRKGNGLVNINKRADQIGADINLKTSEGFGTRWMLKVEI